MSATDAHHWYGLWYHKKCFVASEAEKKRAEDIAIEVLAKYDQDRANEMARRFPLDDVMAHGFEPPWQSNPQFFLGK